MSYQYVVIFEREGRSYGAFVPDLPGCVAVGKNRSIVKRRIREAIALHLEDMRSRGRRLPRPSAEVGFVRADVA